jgi:hypothetical protein
MTEESQEGTTAAIEDTIEEAALDASVETGTTVEETASSQLPENSEETPEVQAEPTLEASDTAETTEPAPLEGALKTEDPPASNEPDWIVQLRRYHHNINGLLAAKENLKIVAVNRGANPAFTKNWSREANSMMRLAVIMRDRLELATGKPHK